jgi:hypothetical protein
MTPTKVDEDRKTRDVLFEHWMAIPAVKFINVEKEVYKSHISRPAILRILRKGITDAETGQKRHALNAKEIKSRLTKSNIRLSITSLYFHLKVLIEKGLIQVVASLPEKRHKVAYYGRVSRHILIESPAERTQKYEKQFVEFANFVKTINPGLKLTGVKKLARQYVTLKRKREKAMVAFVERYEEVIDKEGIDPYVVYEFLKMLDVTNADHNKMLTRIASTFKIDPDGY